MCTCSAAATGAPRLGRPAAKRRQRRISNGRHLPQQRQRKLQRVAPAAACRAPDLGWSEAADLGASGLEKCPQRQCQRSSRRQPEFPAADAPAKHASSDSATSLASIARRQRRPWQQQRRQWQLLPASGRLAEQLCRGQRRRSWYFSWHHLCCRPSRCRSCNQHATAGASSRGRLTSASGGWRRVSFLGLVRLGTWAGIFRFSPRRAARRHESFTASR